MHKERILHIMERDEDWEITSDGLYRATRGFLMRRGHCCGKRCCNCPYVNWHADERWQPIPAENIRRTHGSIAGAKALFAYHQTALAQAPRSECSYHQKMLQHYRLLLERWDR